MNARRLIPVVLLALAVPAIGRAGPTLYDMQHSSVLRLRLPPHLRGPPTREASAKDSDRKRQESPKPAGEKDAASPGPAGTPGAQDDGAGKP